MTKRTIEWRVVNMGDGCFKLQWKGRRRWHNYRVMIDDGSALLTFSSAEKAEQHIREEVAKARQAGVVKEFQIP